MVMSSAPPVDDAPSSPKASHQQPVLSSPEASHQQPALSPDPEPSPADAPTDDKSTSHPNPVDPVDIIEMETFNQILDLDEEENQDFSRGMVWAYFEQAAATFDDMDAAYAAKDLPKLSSLGHFLKGSSAALGVAKVQASCEHIQHYGDLRDVQLETDLMPAEALIKIDATLARVKIEYAEAEEWLKLYYNEP